MFKFYTRKRSQNRNMVEPIAKPEQSERPHITRIIDNRLYDTAKSEFIMTTHYSNTIFIHEGPFWGETKAIHVYRTKNGRFFATSNAGECNILTNAFVKNLLWDKKEMYIKLFGNVEEA